MFVLFHPQLLELHRLCLQRNDVYFGTSQSNSKAAGDGGVRWHSHGGLCDGSGDLLHSGTNNGKLKSPEEYMAGGLCNLVLAYPAGFDGGSGCINIIKGSHLYSDTAVDNSKIAPLASTAPPRSGEEEDALLQANWLKDKMHPVTGAPLRCEEVRLPPGSLIACTS